MLQPESSFVDLLPRYRSHKVVRAAKIATAVLEEGEEVVAGTGPTTITFEDTNLPARKVFCLNRPLPQPGWYYILYKDGYESFSPAEAFESGYMPYEAVSLNALDDALDRVNTAAKAVIDHVGSRGIGWAVKQMQDGAKVRRAGWNGKGMFLFLVPGSTFKVNRAPLLGIYPEGTEINYCPHIDMKTADDKVVPWLASQTDMLAFDWEIAG